jgi:hypothetical protein
MLFVPNQTKPKKCNASVVLTSPPVPQIILKQFFATFFVDHFQNMSSAKDI